MNDLRGSVWRKWDLHVHTPASALSNGFEGVGLNDKWSKYIAKLKTLEDFSVIGVTDYFSVEGYLRLRDEAFPNIDLLLPNVEMRILPVTGSDQGINLHLIFNPAIVDELESKFFTKLEFSFNGETYNCTRDDLTKLGKKFDSALTDDQKAYEEGVNQFKVTKDELEKLLAKDTKLRQNTIVLVSNSSSDGNSGIQHSSLAATRQEIYRFSDIIFSSNPSDREYFLGLGTDTRVDVEKKMGRIKPCVHGCDAHDLKRIGVPCAIRHKDTHDCDKDSDDCQLRYCWIKSDPTYEGLKQIIYEPEARVRIQSNNPEDDFPKPSFKSINIKSGNIMDSIKPQYADTQLVLNRDMVAIIGSRGAGKSLLVDDLALTFNQTEGLDEDKLSKLNRKLDYKVSYSKSDGEELGFRLSDEENNLDYLHVHQGQVKNIATNPKRLDAEIKKLLGITKYKEAVDINDKDYELLDLFMRLVDFLDFRDDDNRKINTLPFQMAQKKRYQELIRTITTASNQERIQHYRSNNIQIEFYKDKLEKADAVREALSDSQELINESIEELDGATPNFESNIDFENLLESHGDSISFNEASGKFVSKKRLSSEDAKSLELVNADDDFISNTKIAIALKKKLPSVEKVEFNARIKVLGQIVKSASSNIETLEKENEKITQDFSALAANAKIDSLALDKSACFCLIVSAFFSQVLIAF